jgi:predicted RecB family endonuclease
MFELRQACAPQYSVKTRVIEALREFPATVRELEAAGCGSPSSIRRVLRALNGVVVLSGRRYALLSPGRGYKLL